MAAGEGKGWARGRTAVNDPRIAKAAERHRGMIYQRRTPLEMCRWPKPRATIQPGWTHETAYVVGLIATDGCLIQGRRRIDFCTADLQLMEVYTHLVGIPGRFSTELTRRGALLYRARFKHAAFYRWLVAVGLTPRKSLTLGAIDVPDDVFASLVRGLLDGDGSITNGVWRADTTRRPSANYYWESLNARFTSASRKHLEWLSARLQGQSRVRGGSIKTTVRDDGRRCYQLSFGKYDSIQLLAWIYADLSALCLLRKRSIWTKYCERHASDPAPRGFGRWARGR